jgi:hypothetical protein
MQLLGNAGRNDPWWDLDGKGVKRDRIRRRIVGGLAFILAIGACGITAAAWIREVAPALGGLGIS